MKFFRYPLVIGALTIIVFYPISGGVAYAQSPKQKLQQIEREIESSRQKERSLKKRVSRLDRGLKSIRGDLIDTAASVQSHEDMVSGIEVKIRALSTEERGKARTLRNQHSDLSLVISSLARLNQRPLEVFITAPSEPLDAVRSFIVLSQIIPELHTRTSIIKSELNALRNLRHEIAGEREALATASETLARERKALDRLLTQTSRLHKQMLSKRAQSRLRISNLAKEAKTLRGLMQQLQKEEERLLRESPKNAAIPKGSRPFSSVRGNLPLPVRGRLLFEFGDRNKFGGNTHGLSLITQNTAQVVAPYDGRILFAGPFRSYGQLLIISHGEGYHSLIAGMARIDGIVGQWLLAGEPVGRMGHYSGSRPILYVELRRNGVPINPIPWLAQKRED